MWLADCKRMTSLPRPVSCSETMFHDVYHIGLKKLRTYSSEMFFNKDSGFWIIRKFCFGLDSSIFLVFEGFSFFIEWKQEAGMKHLRCSFKYYSGHANGGQEYHEEDIRSFCQTKEWLQRFKKKIRSCSGMKVYSRTT